MSQIRIGLVGKKHSGKSTLAEHIVKSYGFKEYAIATPLKETIRQLGFSDHYLYEDKTLVHPDLGVCAREVAQTVSDFYRGDLQRMLPHIHFGSYDSPWVYRMASFIKANPAHPIVISDVRFLDESVALTELPNSILIRVNRRTTPDKFSNHPSEMELESIPCHYTIENEGSKEDLYLKFDTILRDILNQ